MLIHAEIWTLKDLFVLPNENIYWALQIVLYPFMTGLVAGAFVLSSLYHVFGIKKLKDIARFALVFSFSLLFVAPIPLLMHLLHPERALNVFMTPHFTSAIASFGVIFFTYASLVAVELWLLYRKRFVTESLRYREMKHKRLFQALTGLIYTILTLGAYDISEEALHRDEKSSKVAAGIGIPVALFLHGYVGFIFGSVKANALWMTPLMPVIFIASAVVSGIALCILVYVLTTMARGALERRKAARNASHVAAHKLKADPVVVKMTASYLLAFLILAVSLELLDLLFRSYTAQKSWDALRSVIFKHDFMSEFVLQYGLGELLPLLLLVIPGITIRRATIASLFVVFGVLMMRYNVVIGGQAFSLTFSGFMEYKMPIIPTSIETYKEGLFGGLTVFAVPFLFFTIVNKFLPAYSDAIEPQAD